MYRSSGSRTRPKQEAPTAHSPASREHCCLSNAKKKTICQARDCSVNLAALGKPYCVRKGVCPACMKAAAVHVDGYGDSLFRFCFQCAKLEPLALFEGAKRSCSNSLAKRQSPADQPYKSARHRKGTQNRKRGRSSSSSSASKRLRSHASRQWGVELLLQDPFLGSAPPGWEQAARTQAVQQQQQQQLLFAPIDQDDSDLLIDTTAATFDISCLLPDSPNVISATAVGAVLLPDIPCCCTASNTAVETSANLSLAVSGRSGLSHTPSLAALQSGVELSALWRPSLIAESELVVAPELSGTVLLTELSLTPDLTAPDTVSGWQDSHQPVMGSAGPSLAPDLLHQQPSGSAGSSLAPDVFGQQLSGSSAPSLAPDVFGEQLSGSAGPSLAPDVCGQQLSGSSRPTGPLARLEAALSRSLSDVSSSSLAPGLSGPFASPAPGMTGRQASVSSSSGSALELASCSCCPAPYALCEQGVAPQQQQYCRTLDNLGFASTAATALDPDQAIEELNGQQLQTMIELELQTTAIQIRHHLQQQQQQLQQQHLVHIQAEMANLQHCKERMIQQLMKSIDDIQY